MTNAWFLALGVTTLGLAAVHVVAGGRQCAAPLMKSDLDPVAKWTVYVCWHLVSAQLVLGGAAMLWAAFSDPTATTALLVRAISILHLVYAALFVGIGRRAPFERAWLELGQWMAFLPMGALGLYLTS